jgi:D-tyrosyl-tRNA(Tyr) deacylase
VRALLQRVLRASVRVEGREVAAISKGLLVLLGLQRGDTAREAVWLAQKVARLRMFEDSQGKMNLSVLDAGGQVMVVSQFTLLGSTRKGNRPSFDAAEEPQRAQALYREFIQALGTQGVEVKEGLFGAYMQVELVNDGPVTLLLDSRG